MSEQYNPLSPHRIDEAIEQYAPEKPSEVLPEEQRQDRQLIQAMHSMYGRDHRAYQQALQRVEKRLLEQYRQPSLPEQKRQNTRQGSIQAMNDRYPPTSRWMKLDQRLSVFIAGFMLIAIVGGLLFLQSYLHQQANMQAGGTKIQTIPTPAPTPTLIPSPTPPPSANFGHTLYTTPSNPVGFNGLAFSPDSKRIASSTVDGMQIWDATTGKHLVQVHFPASGFPYAISWSPNSQLIAVATPGALLLVNGQSGVVVRSHNAAAANMAPGGQYLSAFQALSGGLGYRAVTWSPDGRFIAGAVSAGATGFIEVLNAQNLTTAYSIQMEGNYVPDALSWSPDGQYLAANVFNTEPGNQTVPPDQMQMIWGWKLSNRQLIFKKSSSSSSGNPFAFQPGTHNITLMAINKDRTPSLQILDIASGKTIKDYAIAGSDPLAWSPDARFIAYMGGGQVNILDANSGQKVYTYTEHKRNVCQLAWSPDGKYIVSGEGQTEGDTVAKVWSAE